MRPAKIKILIYEFMKRKVTMRRISKFALIDIVDFVSLFLETILFEILRYAQDDRYALCSLAQVIT